MTASPDRDRLQVRSWPQAQVPPGLRAQAAALQDAAWPPDDPGTPGAVHDPALKPVVTEPI